MGHFSEIPEPLRLLLPKINHMHLLIPPEYLTKKLVTARLQPLSHIPRGQLPLFTSCKHHKMRRITFIQTNSPLAIIRAGVNSCGTY